MNSNTSPNSHAGANQEHQVREVVSVIIVGAGPTGLTAGNLLGMAGIDTLIIESNASLSDYPKAISLDDEGLRICQAMGLSRAVNKSVLSGIHAHYVSAGRFLAKVEPSSKRNGYSLISTFNQPEFEATLLEGLERFTCVNVLFGTQLNHSNKPRAASLSLCVHPLACCKKSGATISWPVMAAEVPSGAC